jgi:hypothetical protein
MAKFTIEDVQRALGDAGAEVEQFRVSEEKNGVRIVAESHTWEMELLPNIIRAALALQLKPEQLEVRTFRMEDTYGEYASPYLDIDITFLFE